MTDNKATPFRTAKRLGYSAALAETAALTRRTLTTAPLLIRPVTAHLSRAAGKQLRARLLLCCALDENDSVHERAVTVAAAVELLHLATLVHDDIIDDSPVRRGIETLHKKYDRATAVLCGDYLLSVAMRLSAEAADPKADDPGGAAKFSACLERICLGEIEQNMNRFNPNLSLKTYLHIVSGKTAALFEASCRAGAALCAAEEPPVSRHAAFGRWLGMVFQMVDDCNDFELNERASQKPTGFDCAQGVVTLPLMHAMAEDGALREGVQSGTLLPECGIQAVKKAGGVAFARRIAAHYYRKASELVAVISSENTEKREILLWALRFAYYDFAGKTAQEV